MLLISMNLTVCGRRSWLTIYSLPPLVRMEVSPSPVVIAVLCVQVLLHPISMQLRKYLMYVRCTYVVSRNTRKGGGTGTKCS